MILKSYLVEKDISILKDYSSCLIYGENIGLKDDIKNDLKKYYAGYERINFDQNEIIKNNNILQEHINNRSLFSKNKIIFINEVSDKFKTQILNILEDIKPELKLFLFAQNLEKKSFIRELFQKEKKFAIIPCYQDNQRTLSDYLRKKLRNYSGISQETINFLIQNSGLDRKTLFYEIEKIKSLFLDKKIQQDKLLDVLNNTYNVDFDSIRDACFSGEKESLNQNLGNAILQNEDAYFYLANLAFRIEKLFDLNEQFKKEKNIEKAIDNIKPPIFWKDKPVFYKQIKKWNVKKLEEAKEALFEAEILIKSGLNNNNNILIKNLVINLYRKAASTS